MRKSGGSLPGIYSLMAHSALKGQLAEGNQEKMISKEMFLKVNEILSENRHGYSCHEEAEDIPLKRFLKCDHCGTFMRGYVVKTKNLPYYKCNTKGCCNNKNANVIHGYFEAALDFFTLLGNEAIKGFVTKQVVANYNRAHKEKDQSKEAIKRQISEFEKKSERLEERLILEEINLELFNKYSEKFKFERMELEKNFIKSQKRVSNLEHCINIVMDYISKLPSSWALMAYKDKQLLQFLLFPEGIRYNKKNNECRTSKINSVFYYIARLVRDMAEIKRGDIKLLFDIPHLVVPLGIEPSTHRL